MKNNSYIHNLEMEHAAPLPFFEVLKIYREEFIKLRDTEFAVKAKVLSSWF